MAVDRLRLLRCWRSSSWAPTVSLADHGARRISRPAGTVRLAAATRSGRPLPICRPALGDCDCWLVLRSPSTWAAGCRCRSNPTWRGCSRPATPRLWALVDAGPVAAGRGPENSDRRASGPLGACPRIPDSPEPSGPAGHRPGAARAGRSESSDAPLWLLRPRTAGPA